MVNKVDKVHNKQQFYTQLHTASILFNYQQEENPGDILACGKAVIYLLLNYN